MTATEGELAKARVSIAILTGANRGLAEQAEQLKIEVRALREAVARLLEERNEWTEKQS